MGLTKARPAEAGSKRASLPVRRRPATVVTALLLGATVAIGAAAAAIYLAGGGRVSGGGGNIAAPVTIGEEFHTMASLEGSGGPVELVSAVAGTSSADLEADVRLVRLDGRPEVASARGPLDPGYAQIAVAGHEVDPADGDADNLRLDVRLVATTPGRHDVEALVVTYRAGAWRERTAVLPMAVCLDASADWRTSGWRSDDWACADPP